MKTLARIYLLIGTGGIRVLLLLAIFGLVWFFVNLTGAFFWTVFFTFIFFKIDSKYVGQAALLCLICLPFLLAIGKEAVAEQVAVYAFFLLVITVALQIIELKRDVKDTRKLEFIDSPMRKITHTLDLRLKKAVLDLRSHRT